MRVLIISITLLLWKWTLEQSINTCLTIEELDAIEI